jgi:uracil-DNA glycosylase
MSDRPKLPSDWQVALGAEFDKDYFKALLDFVTKERAAGQVFPPEDEVFSAFEHSPFEKTKVVLIGQDPYHDVGQAHGLCFSVKPGISTPPSLVNMYKELKSDLGCGIPNNGYLVPWARQGVLMLNAVMTVRAHTPNSPTDRGWEQFTDAAIKAISARARPAVFLLWGNYAKKKAKLVDKSRHVVIEGAHPSPLSVKLFMGSKPFSKVNAALAGLGETPIDWQIPNI